LRFSSRFFLAAPVGEVGRREWSFTLGIFEENLGVVELDFRGQREKGPLRIQLRFSPGKPTMNVGGDADAGLNFSPLRRQWPINSRARRVPAVA